MVPFTDQEHVATKLFGKLTQKIISQLGSLNFTLKDANYCPLPFACLPGALKKLLCSQRNNQERLYPRDDASTLRSSVYQSLIELTCWESHRSHAEPDLCIHVTELSNVPNGLAPNRTLEISIGSAGTHLRHSQGLQCMPVRYKKEGTKKPTRGRRKEEVSKGSSEKKEEI